MLTARAAGAEAALPPLQAEFDALQVICEVRQRSSSLRLCIAATHRLLGLVPNR